jgi:signal peptide peptidase SppA
VAGAFDLADKIKTVNEQKPVYALAADTMCSACYLLAANASKIIATQTSTIGSIGVVMKHVDLSGLDEKTGIKATYIYAGDHKVDGNPHEPLSEDVKARAQAGVDRIYNMFVDVVSQGRLMERQDVIDTKAETFIGSQAVKEGLADDVMSGEELLVIMNKQFNAYSNHSLIAERGDNPMADEKKENINLEEAKAEAAKEASKATANRIQAIMESEEANGRESMAKHLAYNTDMAAEDAVDMLKTAPVAVANPESPLDMAMANTEQPEVGSDDVQEPSKADGIFSSYQAATGYKTGA